MRLPQFVKSLASCTDPTSSRYALGAVLFEHDSGVTTATATDGRQMVSVSYSDVNAAGTPSGVLVSGASLAKAFGVAGKKARGAKPTTFSVANGKALVNGPGGDAIASIVAEGRFPRYRDVFNGRDGANDTQVVLCPELLSQVLKVYTEAGVDSIRLHVKDNVSGVLISGTSTTGEVVRSVVMPKETDQPKVEFLSAFTLKADAKPATVVMKPVIGPKSIASGDAKARLAALAATAS